MVLVMGIDFIINIIMNHADLIQRPNINNNNNNKKPQQHQQYIIDPRKIKFDNGTELARNAIEEIINRVNQLQRNYQIH